MRNRIFRERYVKRLSKIQQDPLLTPTASLTGIRPQKVIKSDYHNYQEDEQYPECIIQEHDMQSEQDDTAERQIRTDTILSRKLQEEEKNQAIKSNCQTEYDDPLLYCIDRGQVKLEDNYEPSLGTEKKPLVNFNTHQVPDYHDEQEIDISPMGMLSGYFQARANLKTGNKTGIYYNTQPTVTSQYPQEISTVHDSTWFKPINYLKRAVQGT